MKDTCDAWYNRVGLVVLSCGKYLLSSSKSPVSATTTVNSCSSKVRNLVILHDTKEIEKAERKQRERREKGERKERERRERKEKKLDKRKCVCMCVCARDPQLL